MSQQVKPLSRGDVWANVRPMPRLSEEVRLRLREEMTRLDMSQRDVAGILGWSQSRVAHLLTGRVEMSVDDLAEFGSALSIRPTELVRDHGLEFCADMTPTELRTLEHLRQLDPEVRDAWLRLLRVKAPESRRASPAKGKTKKA